jgi:methanogenic corrinoid protein MtbC1
MATLRPRGGRLWTSAEAARAFRVGVSSVKRWTDEAELESVRTPGGHRRYTLKALHHFASARRLPTDLLPPLEPDIHMPQPPDITLFEALVRGDADAVRGLVMPPPNGLAKRATFLDRVVGDAMREIGERWERGELGVDEEHRASHMLEEAIDRLRPPIAAEGPLALLTCPPDEWHDLPLRLLRLFLEWSGWRTELIGANLPWESAISAVTRARPTVLAITTRDGEPFRSAEFARLLAHCAEAGVRVVVGGEWARGGGGTKHDYFRFRSLRGFERWLRTRQQG